MAEKKQKQKYNVPHDDIKEIFESVISDSLLDRYINITILSDDNSKKVAYVKKCSLEEKFKTNDDLNIIRLTWKNGG